MCVSFIGGGWGPDVDPRGSAFLVGTGERIYLVTAKHVLDAPLGRDGRPFPPYDRITCRLNVRGGGVATEIDTDIDRWERHATADVAVYPFDRPPRPEVFEYMVLPFLAITGGEAQPVAMGRELLIMGLFVHHPGETRMVPVSRVGVVAAVPVDPLPDRSTEGRGMFLAELRSIGGVSGSPVFLEAPAARMENGSFMLAAPAFSFIGLVQSVWEESGRSSVSTFDRATEPLNVGISAIEPAARVRELIEQVEARG